MEPISAIYTGTKIVGATKVGVDAAYNLEHLDADALSAYIVSLASAGSASMSPTVSAYIDTAKQSLVVLSALDNMEHINAGNLVALGIQPHGKDVSTEKTTIAVPLENGSTKQETILAMKPVKNTGVQTSAAGASVVEKQTDVLSVESRYLAFGHLQDFLRDVSKGNVPSARLAYLALLDIIDAMDMNLFGDKITQKRIQDNLQHHRLDTRKITSERLEIKPIEAHKAEDEKVKTSTQNARSLVTHVEEAEILWDGEKIGGVRLTHLQDELRTSIELENVKSLKEKWWGAEVQKEHIEKTSIRNTQRLESFDAAKKQMVLVNESSQVSSEPISRSIDKTWESGYFSYVPVLGTGVDISRKVRSGYSLNVQDGIAIISDVILVAVIVSTAGTAAPAVESVKKGGYKVLGNVSTKAATKTAVRKSACSAAASKELGTRYDHLGRIFSSDRVAVKAATTAHNPMKADFMKGMVKLQQLESNGTNIKRYLKTEFASQGKIGELRAYNLERQFRFAKQQGLLSQENVARMAKGQNPFNKLGHRMDLDHIIPKSLAPELKAEPANLAFLNQMENIAKNNSVSRHVVQHIDRIKHHLPDWQPNEALQRAISPMKMVK